MVHAKQIAVEEGNNTVKGRMADGPSTSFAAKTTNHTREFIWFMMCVFQT